MEQARAKADSCN